MPERDLYLAAYDISDPRRLREALRVARTYAAGGQKSVHEVFLTPVEKRALLQAMRVVIDAAEDRFFLLRLDPRARCHTLGVAEPPVDLDYLYVG